MKEGPDIALIGSLIGDPARANMLNALMNGIALTATELAGVAGITPQTASMHLKKLQSGGLLQQRKQGRHRYFALADEDVASVLESLAILADKKGHIRVRTGPKDPHLRKARVCYNHLAGDMGVHLYDSLVNRNFLTIGGDDIILTDAGRDFAQELDINIDDLSKLRRPLCKPCLDWSVRRSHLAGALGTALLEIFIKRGWAKRQTGTRIIDFSRNGNAEFYKLFPQQIHI